MQISFPSKNGAMTDGRKPGTIELAQPINIPPSSKDGEVFSACVLIEDFSAFLNIFVTYAPQQSNLEFHGDKPATYQPQSFQLIVTPPGETTITTPYKERSSSEGAQFSYVHPESGSWCASIFVDDPLAVPLELIASSAQCPRGFTGSECDSAVIDLFASRRSSDEMTVEFLTISGEALSGQTTSDKPTSYVRFHVDEEMVGGLLELTLHCHHTNCHDLAMTPSFPMTDSGDYGGNSDDLGGTVLVAAARFPHYGWWCVSIESETKHSNC